MKNKIYFLSMLLVLVTASCQKQLNTVPTDFLTPVNYYKTEDDLNKALTGVYETLGTDANDGGFYQNHYLHLLSYSNDEGIFAFSQSSFRTTSVFKYSTSDVYINYLWNILYTGINRANVLLDVIDNATDVSADKRAQIKAQALFLRGYYYFVLAEHWGGVPMRLTAIKSSIDVSLARTPLAGVYAQVTKDMEAAEAVLPQASVLGATSSGRVSKNTCQGMLARVYLTWAGAPANDESKYAEALKWSKKCITTGDNQLNPDYTDNFVKEARDEYYVKELMWEVEFFGNVSDTHREQGYVGVRNGVRSDNGNAQVIVFPGYVYSFLRPTGKLYNLYTKYNATTQATKDLRRERVIAPYEWVDAVNPITKTLKTTVQPYDRWPGKWRRDEEITLPRFKNGNGTNFPILRYSDVLLMFAEAENRVNGPTAAAYDAINQVRRRAYGSGNRVISINVTNGGSGYNTVPNITIDNSQGTNGAIAYATIAAGKVATIVIQAPGGFYTGTPAVTIAGTTGTGATATAVMEAINPAEAELTPGLGKDAFFNEIKDERARELAFECLRQPDLRRWGILIPTMQALANDYRSAPAAIINSGTRGQGVEPGDAILQKHLLWPIPAREVQLNNAIVQNPGW